MMTRQDIIEKAKLRLPSFEDNIQDRIIIRIEDKGLIHEVEFERCYVSQSEIVRKEWSFMSDKFVFAWIPSGYFENLQFGGVKSLEQIENEEHLKDYLRS